MKFLFVFALSLVAVTSIGCSTSSADPNAPACSVVVTNYDTSCTQDSDCVAAPPGGDTCGTCVDGNPAFECLLSAINTVDSARYQSALASVRKNGSSTVGSSQCGTSCPAPGKPKCIDNACQMTYGPDGG